MSEAPKEFGFDLDEDVKRELDAHAALMCLPPEGVIAMSIAAVANSGGQGEQFRMLPGNEYLLNIADRFENKPPKTKEEEHEFAEMLRYAAQFMTTRLIHAARFDDERPAKEDATA